MVVGWAQLRSSSSALIASAISGVSSDQRAALAGHEQEPSCAFNKMGTSAHEPQYPVGRDGVRADIRVIDPNPDVIDGLVRSIYIQGTSVDAMEFGWKWINDTQIVGCCDVSPRVFAVKVYAGNVTVSEDGTNAGAGSLPQSSNHEFAIRHDPDGNDPVRYEFRRDGMYFGFFNSDRMQYGGFLTSATEGWARPCEDMQMHAWTLQKQGVPGGTWTDWSGVAHGNDVGTKWWYFDKATSGADSPQWWLKHCQSAHCPDA
jgi:hypothetical protein